MGRGLGGDLLGFCLGFRRGLEGGGEGLVQLDWIGGDVCGGRAGGGGWKRG